MQGASLTINFRDESSPGAGGQAGSPQQGAPPVQDIAGQQVQAITQAGGVQAFTNTRSQSPSVAPSPATPVAEIPTIMTAPVPDIITSTSTLKDITEAAGSNVASAQKFHAEGASIEEIAQLLGMRLQDVEQAIHGTQRSTSSPVAPTTNVDDALVNSTREAWNADLVGSTRHMWEQERVANDEANRADDERRRQEDLDYLNTTRRPPPPPVEPPPVSRGSIQDPYEAEAIDMSGQVQATVNGIAHFAHMMGPLGSAAAGLATTATAIPGAAAAMGNAAPFLAVAAPYLGAAAAVAAVPAIAASMIESTASRAYQQVQGLSADVAMADAQAQVRQLMANIRTSEVLGDEIAEWVSNKSRFQSSTQSIRDDLFEPILKDFNNATGVLAKVSESIAKLLDGPENKSIVQGGLREAALQLMNQIFPGSGELLRALSAVGSVVKDKPDEAIHGLMGIIEQRPALPPPFVADGRATMQIPKSTAMGL